MTLLKVSPDINQKFVDFYRSVFVDGALDRKTKELIALSVSLVVGCGHWFESHSARARRLGASDLEIREAIAVAEVLATGSLRNLVVESSEGAQSDQTW
jgi:AhpD family alkylhydroperoxidase